MKEICLEAVKENIPQATAFVEAELEALDCPLKTQMLISVAIDEVFTNIASYAYAPGTGKALIRFEYDEGSHTALITFIDSGVPFDPLENPDPDVTLSAEERAIGGLGIFMVKKTMDEMVYERKGNENVLRISKKLY